MRPLTDTETQTLFQKLANYTGRSLSHLISDTTLSNGSSKSADRHVFRVQKDRIYYVRESIARLAESVPRSNLLSLGTCLGKFTKTGKGKGIHLPNSFQISNVHSTSSHHSARCHSSSRPL